MGFNFVKLSELNFELNSETTEKGRSYKTPQGKIYPSITTVLSPYNKKALFEWRKKVGEEEANRIARKASSRGTKLHTICEKYLLNEITDMSYKTMMPDTKELFKSIRNFLDENIQNVYGIEQPLYSDKLRVAGRCDCIADWNNEISIIDWKTSSREKSKDGIRNYFMQAAAYAEMFTERTGLNVNQIVIAIAVEGSSPQIFVEQKDKYLKELNTFIDLYFENNKT